MSLEGSGFSEKMSETVAPSRLLEGQTVHATLT
jgi:hypothetical protein